MMKISLRKIRSDFERRGSEIAGDRLFILFLLFVFGMFLGSMASSGLFVGLSLSFDIAGNVSINSLFFLLLIFFSTSYLGCFLIPALVAIRGFLFSAIFSSVYSFSLSSAFLTALFSEALPTLIFLPCFFLVSEDCICHSRMLIQLRFRRIYAEKTVPFFRHVLLGFTILIVDYFYCIYIMPILLG